MNPARVPERAVQAQVSIGIDTGGTHTDLVLVGSGRVLTLKVPSTPEDLSHGILDGIRRILSMDGLDSAVVARFVYASTLVTNLIVEEREAHVGLITTEGFRDVLEIRRASRKPDVYNIHWRPPKPIVPRHLRYTVPERIDASGRVLKALDEAATRTALESLARQGVQTIAVCLLHAYANPQHERQIARIAAEVCPQIDVSLSCDVVREFREFERTSTTCVSALIRRPITRHLTGLSSALRENGITATPFIMRGNGGISTFEAAARLPAALAHSGPMGGIVGATALARACDIDQIITLDMGGTSADVSLVSGGEPLLTNHSTVGQHPLLLPTLDLVTIGAGGGSIAWIDGGSGLRVGPRSAGSVPGPACYGQGGADPTVTDANLATGRLNPDYFLAGARRLSPDRAHDAIRDRIASPLGMTPDEAALGIIAIAESHMVNAIRLVSIERGLDPRDFTLVAFGGAGPLHAAALADALSIRSVLIPPAPGNLSAMGLLCADVRHDLTRTLVAEVGPAIVDRITATFEELLQEGEAALVTDLIAPHARQYQLGVDLRYQGQNYELALPVTRYDASSLDDMVQRFHEYHRTVYGYHLKSHAVQLVRVRVTAIGRTDHAAWPVCGSVAREPVPVATRRILLASGAHAEVPVYRMSELFPGQEIAGPSLVEYPGSTLFLSPGWRARFDERMNARMSRDASAGIDANRAQTPLASKELT